ncbi:hypothetical protein NEFER03_1287 [Nematocida sp. LUAm3]|nr:hypothetical protein NEFER03_1287 [Nematocida sp. LUAm3]KAI5174091.1 hypothetical protein NEFER02_0558 [Nematocida sp. LUAm2]KAI5177166.1 hypothetical protein NEFER01_0441 [Nematocida sp. LUAm1]
MRSDKPKGNSKNTASPSHGTSIQRKPPKSPQSKAFHAAEKPDEEKYKELKEELKNTKAIDKPVVEILAFSVKRWVEVIVDLLIFFLILIPELYEFGHVLVERVYYHKSKSKTYTEHSLTEALDLWCPILEGVVCLIHSIVFFLESFVGVEVPYGIAISIAASLISCILIMTHVELVDVKRCKHHPVSIFLIEFLVVSLTSLTIIAFISTEDRFRTFILITTIITQFLCKSLTRTVEESHNSARQTINKVENRILIGFSLIFLIILLQITIMYINI